MPIEKPPQPSSEKPKRRVSPEDYLDDPDFDKLWDINVIKKVMAEGDQDKIDVMIANEQAVQTIFQAGDEELIDYIREKSGASDEEIEEARQRALAQVE